MIYKELDNMIASAMKSRDSELLEVLKLIKCEFVNSEKNGTKLDDVTETKLLLKMVAQREDSIRQYIDGGRSDLADTEKKELAIIQKYLPKQASEEEISEYTRATITAYKLTKEEGYNLSMKDTKPILSTVVEKYPTANGKIVSSVLKQFIYAQ